MLATSLCLLNIDSQANDNPGVLLSGARDISSYQDPSSDIPQDYAMAASEIDEIFRKENSLTKELSIKIESYATGDVPRPDITLFLIIHMAKKVALWGHPYIFGQHVDTTKNTVRKDICNYLDTHFDVKAVSYFMPQIDRSHDSLCEELKECVAFLSGRHGFLMGMNTPGYKDTVDNEADREIYSQFLDIEEELLDFLINYKMLRGFMISNVNFKGVLQNLPFNQRHSIGENKGSFVRNYPNLKFISIGFDAVKYSDFLYSFLYDSSPDNRSTFFFMHEFLQKKRRVYEQAEELEESKIERLRLKLADLTGKEENSSFDSTYAALLEQYGLSQQQRLSQDVIEKEKGEYVLKLALAISASEKLKEKSRDLQEQLEILNIIKDKLTVLLKQDYSFRNKQYYKSYNPRSIDFMAPQYYGSYHRKVQMSMNLAFEADYLLY
jgi:hypothetical protein